MLPSVVAPFLPILWAGIASAIWRRVSSPWLFTVAALLALFGIQLVVSFLWDPWPHVTGNYFLEYNNVTAAQMQSLLEERNRAAIIQAVIAFFVGFPFIRWLKRGLAT
jgi:hypothetical protein